jgi:hypothetical protein
MIMKYSLVRVSGSYTVGDSGPMCQILDGESYQPIEGCYYPRVGCGVRVGSYHARTFSGQDWWQTTPVTEILEESVDEKGYRRMKFKTKNSIYEWKEF